MQQGVATEKSLARMTCPPSCECHAQADAERRIDPVDGRPHTRACFMQCYPQDGERKWENALLVFCPWCQVHRAVRFFTSAMLAGQDDPKCNNCKQKAKDVHCQWSILMGSSEWPGSEWPRDIPDVPDSLLRLVNFAFFQPGPGSSKAGTCPFVRLNAMPAGPTGIYLCQAMVWKNKMLNKTKECMGHGTGDVYVYANFTDEHGEQRISWPLRKQSDSSARIREQMADIDEGNHSYQGVTAKDVTEVLLERLQGQGLVPRGGGVWEWVQGGWVQNSVPRCVKYMHPDGNVYWELGRARYQERCLTGSKRTRTGAGLDEARGSLVDCYTHMLRSWSRGGAFPSTASMCEAACSSLKAWITERGMTASAAVTVTTVATVLALAWGFRRGGR